MRHVIFYRTSEMKADELDAARRAGFHCIRSRMGVREGDLVVGRFSVMPFYREVAEDIEYVGGTLVNSIRQHAYIADLRNWVEDLGELTPKTWYRLDEIMFEKGPFVLKGPTSSRKEHWKSHMYAADSKAAVEVCERLLMDGLIGQKDDAGLQHIYVRQYVPLVTYARGIYDLPITKEFRIFVCRGKVLCKAFYWSNWDDTCLEADPGWTAPEPSEIPEEFIQAAIDRIGDRASFYAMDVAQDETGRWWVIEINDGQMSGLSGNDPLVFYQGLTKALMQGSR